MPMLFKVMGIEKDVFKMNGSERVTAKIQLEYKHPDTIYTSTIHMRVPWSEVSAWQIDTEYALMPSMTGVMPLVDRVCDIVDKAGA